jgi:transposase
MKLYCGLYVSNKSTSACIIDRNGRVLFEGKGATSRSGLEKLLKEFKGLQCVVEAGSLAETVCMLVETLGHKVEILDARHAKAVTATKRKTDSLDARNLAQVCRTGWYKRVHRKSGDARELRSYLVSRRQLVKVVTSTASAIRGILRAHGIIIETGDGKNFEEKVLKSLKQEASPMLREAIGPLLMTWKQVRAREVSMYRTLNRQIAKKNKDIQHLMTVPGVGPATAAAFVATIDTPQRFKSSEQVASYLGLVPSVYQSGETEIKGRITKNGDELLRWLLIEAATTMLSRSKKEFPLRKWGLRLQEQKGFGKARVAVARKLACLLHHLWVTGQPFQATRSLAR